jgi:hypothetical protein
MKGMSEFRRVLRYRPPAAISYIIIVNQYAWRRRRICVNTIWLI